VPQPLRILHLISSLDPAGGGPSEGLRQITACYQSLGAIAGNVTGFSGRIFQRWILSGLKRAQHVVCVSEQTRSELRRLGASAPSRDELRALVQGSGLAAHIHEWTELANEDLRALYSTAEALLFPSLQEGFGWPIAEAQACGCVVVTSNRAPMTEVGGDAAVYIDPDDAPGAAAVIAGTLADRDDLVEAGLRNAERFSGAQMVEGYVAAYRRVVAAAQ